METIERDDTSQAKKLVDDIIGAAKPASTQTGSYDKFLEFRVAVIQLVAEAWDHWDPEKNDFTEEFKTKLQNTKGYMKETLGYEFPFDMDLEVIFKNAVWEPETVVDWKVNATNTLSLFLPPAPPVEEQAKALAKFNADHITFLGPHKTI